MTNLELLKSIEKIEDDEKRMLYLNLYLDEKVQIGSNDKECYDYLNCSTVLSETLKEIHKIVNNKKEWEKHYNKYYSLKNKNRLKLKLEDLN